jgi:D-alanine-D-alanine ligase
VKPLRVLALVPAHAIPPDSLEGHSKEAIAKWRMEYDVISTLRASGHTVDVVGVTDNLGHIREAIHNTGPDPDNPIAKPDVAFHMLEEFAGVPVYDHHVAGYLELMRMPYTGCNPRGLMLARDKALAKKILHYHRIPVPQGAVFPWGRVVRPPKRLVYPQIVKSVVDESSTGMTQKSIVQTPEELTERVVQLQESCGHDVLSEEFIAGRELYVGVLGNDRLQVFPTWELFMPNLRDDAPMIATAKVKFDLEYQKKIGVVTRAADPLPNGLAERIPKLIKRVYRKLHLSGYARIDLRVTDDGRVYVLEANPNPDLSAPEDFAKSAEAAGLSYPKLLEKILRLGLRYRAEWKG